MDTPGVNEALAAFVTWALTMALRKWAPDVWSELGDRRIRIAAVGFLSVCTAIIAGISQGLGVWAIARLALSALSGAVLIRQATKPDLRYGELDLTRATSIRTPPPKPHYD